jgi:hypothetical protein
VPAFRLLLLAAIGFSASGQTAQFDALEKALGLSAAQVDFLKRWTPPKISTPALGPDRSTAAQRRGFSPDAEGLPADLILTDPQRAKLEIVKTVLNRFLLARLTISYGLIGEEEWPWGIQSPCYQPPLSASYSELGLTPNQVSQLERLPRESAVRDRIAVLSDSQKAQLSRFEDEIELAREAIELHLIPPPVIYNPLQGGEFLCH